MVWNKYTQFNHSIESAPILEILLINPRKNRSITLSSLIDTGASRTALPLSILRNDLNLQYINERLVSDFEGYQFLCKYFVLDIQIQGNTFPNVLVIGTDNKTTGCLGRDLLKYHFLRCDGPGQKFELEFT